MIYSLIVLNVFSFRPFFKWIQNKSQPHFCFLSTDQHFKKWQFTFSLLWSSEATLWFTISGYQVNLLCLSVSRQGITYIENIIYQLMIFYSVCLYFSGIHKNFTTHTLTHYFNLSVCWIAMDKCFGIRMKINEQWSSTFSLLLSCS